MRTPHAGYSIVEDRLGEPLLIRDLGPWTKHPTITNDAEYVVKNLIQRGRLTRGRRLFYIDSDGNKDEIMVADGRFAGFHQLPRTDKK